MRILILGGSGYLGSHTAEECLRQGYQVRVLSRRMPGLLPEWVCSHPRFESVVGDLSCPAVCREVLADCACVIHCIGTCSPAASFADPIADWQQQVAPTLTLLQTIRTAEASPRLIFISSGGTVYGPDCRTPTAETDVCRPICPYGIHKLVVEHYLHQEHYLHGLDYIVLRLANPYGGRQRSRAQQGAPSVFMKKMLDGEPIHLWGDGSVKRDFLHVFDVVRALIRSVVYQGSARVFNVGSSQAVSLSELIRRIESLTNRKALVQCLPARPFDVPVSELDITLIANEMQWAPSIDLDSGLSASLAILAAEG